MASQEAGEVAIQLHSPSMSLDDADIYYLDHRGLAYPMGAGQYCVVDVYLTKPDLSAVIDALDLQGNTIVDMEMGIGLDTSLPQSHCGPSIHSRSSSEQSTANSHAASTDASGDSPKESFTAPSILHLDGALDLPNDIFPNTPLEFDSSIKTPFHHLQDRIRAEAPAPESSVVDESSFNIVNSLAMPIPQWVRSVEYLIPSEDEELEAIQEEEHQRYLARQCVVEQGQQLKSKLRVRGDPNAEVEQKAVYLEDLRAQACINNAWFEYGAEDGADPYKVTQSPSQSPNSNSADYQELYDMNGVLYGYEWKRPPSPLRKVSLAYKDEGSCLSTVSSDASSEVGGDVFTNNCDEQFDGERLSHLTESGPESCVGSPSEDNERHHSTDDEDDLRTSASDVGPAIEDAECELIEGTPCCNDGQSSIIEPSAQATPELCHTIDNSSEQGTPDGHLSLPPRPSNPSPQKARRRYRFIDPENDCDDSVTGKESCNVEENEETPPSLLHRMRAFADLPSSSPRTPQDETRRSIYKYGPIGNAFAPGRADQTDGHAKNVEFLCTSLRNVSEHNEDLADKLVKKDGENANLQNQACSLQNLCEKLGNDLQQQQIANEQLKRQNEMLKAIVPQTSTLTAFLSQYDEPVTATKLDEIEEEPEDELNEIPRSQTESNGNSQATDQVTGELDQGGVNRIADQCVETMEELQNNRSRPHLAWSLNKPLPPRPDSNGSPVLVDESTETTTAHHEVDGSHDVTITIPTEMKRVSYHTKAKKALKKGWQKSKSVMKQLTGRLANGIVLEMAGGFFF